MGNFRLLLMVLVSITTLLRGYSQEQPSPIWDIDGLTTIPSVDLLDTLGRVHTLLYESVPYHGRKTTVFAYYSNPDILAGKKSNRKFPGVVLVHGGGGKAYEEWVEKWAADGYAAIAMDLSGKDGAGIRLRYAGPDQADENKFDQIEKGPLEDVWIYHSVASVVLAHSWLLADFQVDPSKTFITGISWGGFVTQIVASLDHRFRAAAPIYGCGYLDEADTFKHALNRLSSTSKAKWMRYFDPSAYLSGATIPFLFMNGNKDRHFNVIPYHKTYRLVPDSNRFLVITPDMKHGHYEGWLPPETRYFFDHFAHGNAKLPKVEKAAIRGRLVVAEYISEVSLLSAAFYYTTDIESTNEKRKWYKVDVLLADDGKSMSCALPENGFAYGFFYVRDHRDAGGSSEFIIQ